MSKTEKTKDTETPAVLYISVEGFATSDETVTKLNKHVLHTLKKYPDMELAEFSMIRFNGTADYEHIRYMQILRKKVTK